MGFWSTLGKIGSIAAPIIAAPFTGGASLTSLPSILGAAGAGLGAISQGQASNRGEKFGGQMDLERLLMQRELTNNASRKDAYRGLLSAQRTINPAARPQLAGKYSIAPRQATGAELEGADALTREVMARLQGGPTQSTVDPKLLDPGLIERILGYASPVLSGLGRQQPQLAARNPLQAANYLQQAPRA